MTWIYITRYLGIQVWMSGLDYGVGCVQYCIITARVCFVPHGALLALVPAGMWYINM